MAETTGASTTRYLYGPGGLAYAQVRDGTVEYLHHDQLGSTRVITNAAGATIGRASFDAYGKPDGTSGTATTRLGYAGQYTDLETGYQYLRARYYDPTTAQFLTRDPIVSATREAYGYTGSNPLNATDPSGLYCLSGVASRNGDGSERCNGASEVLDNATDVAPGGVGLIKPMAEWQWNHPDEHADVLGGVAQAAGFVAGASALAAIFSGGGSGPIAAGALAIGLGASCGQMVQGVRAGDSGRVLSGGVGAVASGFGAGVGSIAKGLGLGEVGRAVVDLVVAVYEWWAGQLAGDYDPNG